MCYLQNAWNEAYLFSFKIVLKLYSFVFLVWIGYRGLKDPYDQTREIMIYEYKCIH